MPSRASSPPPGAPPTLPSSKPPPPCNNASPANAPTATASNSPTGKPTVNKAPNPNPPSPCPRSPPKNSPSCPSCRQGGGGFDLKKSLLRSHTRLGLDLLGAISKLATTGKAVFH